MITIERIIDVNPFAIKYGSSFHRFTLSNSKKVIADKRKYSVGNIVVHFGSGTWIKDCYLPTPLKPKNLKPPIDDIFVPSIVPGPPAHIAMDARIENVLTNGFILPLFEPIDSGYVNSPVDELSWIADYAEFGCIPDTKIGTDLTEAFRAMSY